MGKITIFGIIAFIVALSVFLLNNYIQGVAEDAMLDATGQVVKDSPIDQQTKTSILSTLTLYEIAGFFVFIGGIVFLVKKFF
ncbi:hypothetical protein HYU07_03030 [Candidatus Woesearchaeota archaeon]|nr:hypothetical protein [Candidatus Woesearchaeota archaeon]